MLMAVTLSQKRKDKRQNLWERKRNNESKNLLVNEEKTEYTTVKTISKEEVREWRNMIKLGSKLGGREVIQRRKELVTIALAKNDTIWKKNWKKKLTTRIRL